MTDPGSSELRALKRKVEPDENYQVALEELNERYRVEKEALLQRFKQTKESNARAFDVTDVLMDSTVAKTMFKDLLRPSDAGMPVNRRTVIRPYASSVEGVPRWSTARILGDFPLEHLSPLHTALIEPTFGTFLDVFRGVRNGCPLERKAYAGAYACAHELLMLAPGNLDVTWNEETWNTAYIKILSPLIDESLVKVEATTQSIEKSFGTTDGTVAVHGLPVLNIEVKMPGNPNYAELQNDQYFMRMVADIEGKVPSFFKAEGIWPSCFLVDIYEQHIMVVRGVVFTPPSIISSTLATVNMVVPSHSDEHMTLARALQGLREGVAILKSRYTKCSANSLRTRVPLPVANHIGRLLPRNFVVYSMSMQEAFMINNETKENETFVIEIGAPFFSGHMAFEATILSGPAIDGIDSTYKKGVLKIARKRYGLDAHMAAALGGIAPNIWGYRRLEGGWHAVLMDYINVGSGWKNYNPCDELQVSTVERAYRAHVKDKNFVHGDLRPSNILVLSIDVNLRVGEEQSDLKAASPGSESANEGRLQICIIDWDWAGPFGETHYPLSMNVKVKRAEGAKPGELILPEHDLQQLIIPEW